MILIAGEGRSGTTLLLYFLSELLSIPFVAEEFLKSRRTDFPGIIKHISLGINLGKWMTAYNWKVRVLFWMTLGIEEAVNKQLAFEHDKSLMTEWKDSIWKFLGISHSEWKSLSIKEQRMLLRETFISLRDKSKAECEKMNVPFYEINYPRFCLDVNYAFNIINKALGNIDEEKFVELHSRKIDLSKLKQYKKILDES